jgi:hypothetical protein
VPQTPRQGGLLRPAGAESRTELAAVNQADTALEKHYSVAEIASAWALSRDTVRRMFLREPGVLVIAGPEKRYGRRPYRSIRIPASVAHRVHQRLTRSAA